MSTEYQCVKTIRQVDHAQVIGSHDFNLDLYAPDRYTIRLLRNPEECLRSWFLLDVRLGSVQFTKEEWESRRRIQIPYLLGFNDKYRFCRTVTFEEILDNPNEILEEICYILKHPFSPLDIPKHTPRNLDIWPFV